MKQTHFKKHLLALLLAVCLILQCVASIGAVADTEVIEEVTVKEISSDQISARLENSTASAEEPQVEAPYADTDMVRVSIVLKQPSAIDKGFALDGIGTNRQVRTYRASLEAAQAQVSARISSEILDGAELDSVWNLTLAANLISANVPYGAIDEIAALDGVAAVYIETRYEVDTVENELDTVTAGSTMTGTTAAWAIGYTGAGTRVAIIDTGTDTDHQSFDNSAYLYSLYQNAAAAVAAGEFETVDDYIASLDLLDAAEINSVLMQLNATKRYNGLLAADALYISEKLPYGFNYVDADLDVTHDNDAQGSHGSHVGGIAAANRYIPSGDSYVTAADTVYAVGQAPDAQIITMKVAGKTGGIYDSDYMAALEDAIILGCDAVNMSIGSVNIAYSYSGNEYYDNIFASLQGTGLVLANSGGNAYSYAQFGNTGYSYMYADDVNNGRIGAPSAYPNSLAVASVDNTGFTGPTTSFAEGEVVISVTDAGNPPAGFETWYTLDTSEDGSGTAYEYVFLGDPSWLLDPAYTGENAGNYQGAPADFEGLDVEGKIVLIARGNLSFFEKHMNAVAAGAKAVIVYNNTYGAISMDISSSTCTNPCCSILMSEAAAIFAASQMDENGHRGGTVVIKSSPSIIFGEEGAAMTMSEFSSWGVPDNLSMKPEITAPGGSIYSINGVDKSGTAYETMSGTSMASPQVAGMSALMAQYISENGLTEQTGLSSRTLTQSLLMSTAAPIIETETGLEYSVRKQGAGLAVVSNAVTAGSYILVGDVEGNDGKVKAEFGDDPQRNGVYSFTFSINNLRDTELRYEIGAQMLAPAVASDGVDLYMLNTMVALSSQVSYTSAAKVCNYYFDFDGDKDVDPDDAQLLLDYVAGNAESICHLEYADVSGNGQVDEYDVYALLDCIEAGSYEAIDAVVVVPANGSAEVTMTITLSEEDRAYIDTYFANGTYVEGYVYIQPVADEEGLMDVTHSIPMLGFYGSWSEGSMYDRGEYTMDFYNYISGTPTPHYTTTAPLANYMATKMNGALYYYGLNPFTVDDEYLPERASLNSTNGNSIAKVFYALIRNSAETKAVVTDAETGEVYFEKSFGSQSAAFYYVNAGAWYNTELTASLNWRGTDAEGNALPDGTRATVSLISASEYYLNEDGTVRWDKLEDGAVYSMPVLIDNGAPELLYAVQITDSLTGESYCEVEVQDNHYVAAVSLLNSSGSRVLGTLPVNQTEEGVASTLRFTLSGIIGTEFILAVTDYAGNTRYYSISIMMESSTGNFYGFNTTFDSWVNFGADVNADESVMATTDRTFVAGDYGEGYIFALAEDGDLYATSINDMSQSYRVGELLYSYVNLTYDDATATLYGARNYGNGRTYLYAISLTNGLERYVRTLDADLKAITAVGDGSFYGLTAEGDLYCIDDASMTLVGNVGTTISGIQSITVAGDKLYWARGTELVAVSLTDASCEVVGTLSGTTTCLISTVTGGSSFGNADAATAVLMNYSAATMYLTNELQLEATVRPWYAVDKSVTWTSSDETVATVDSNGLVRALSVGTTVITATSNLTPSLSATCTVTVEALDLTITAATSDMNGDALLISRNMRDGVCTETKVNGLYNVVAATVDESTNDLWVMDDGATIYRLDEAAGAILESVRSGSGIAVSDMTYSETFGGYYSVYGSYLLVSTGFDENSPGSGFDMSGYFAANTGATAFVAVASMGSTTLSGAQCDALLVLDNAGYVWQFYIAMIDGSYSAQLGLVATGLTGKINATGNSSAVFVENYGTAGGLMVSLDNGDGTSTLYMIDAGNTASVSKLTSLNYVPVALYALESASGEIVEDAPMFTELMDGVTVQAEALSSIG